MANILSDIDFNAFCSMIECPHPGVSPQTTGFHIQHILSFNITSDDMTDSEDARLWRDIKALHIRRIINMLSEITLRRDIGSNKDSQESVLGKFNYLYIKEDIPRVMISTEDLLSARDYTTVVGIRVWLHILDPEMKYDAGLLKVLTENAQKNDTEEQGNNSNGRDKNKFNKNGPKPKSNYTGSNGMGASKSSAESIDPFSSITDPSTLAQNVYYPYTNDERFREVDKLFKGINAIDVRETMTNNGLEKSLMNPYNVFSPESAIEFKYNPTFKANVCERQCNLDNYFRSLDGVSPRTWKGFPFPNRCYKIVTKYFEPSFLYKAPLPYVLHKEFLQEVDVVKKKVEDLREEAGAKIKEKERLEEELQTTRSESRKAALQKRLKDILDELKEKEKDIRLEEDKIRRISFHINDRFGYIADGFGKGTFEEQLAEENVTIELRLKNKVKEADIRNKYKSGTPEFVEAMCAFYDKAIQEFSEAIMRDNRATDPILDARKLLKSVQKERHFAECNISIVDISLFANMIVKQCMEINYIWRIFGDPKYIILGLLSVFNAGYYAYKLKNNILYEGEGGVGKSTYLNYLKENSFPGSFIDLVYYTPQTFNTKKSLSDFFFIFDEMPSFMLGIDKHGNKIPSDPMLKSRLTSQKTSTLAYTQDEFGNRTLSFINTRCMGTTIGADNTLAMRPDDPLGQRFQHYEIKDRSKSSTFGKAELGQTVLTPEMQKEKFIHLAHMRHAYIFLWHKAIEAGAMPEINLDIPRVVANEVFTKLQDVYHFKHPDDRKIIMYLDNCRSLTMWYGVHAEFFSEMGAVHRYDENGKIKGFDLTMLKHLRKWSVATMEIAQYALTLMESIWIPSSKLQIMKVIHSNIIDWPPKPDSYKSHFKKDRVHNNNNHKNQHNDDPKPESDKTNNATTTPDQSASNPSPQPQQQQSLTNEGKEEEEEEEEEGQYFSSMAMTYKHLTGKSLTPQPKASVSTPSNNTTQQQQPVRYPLTEETADVRYVWPLKDGNSDKLIEIYEYREVVDSINPDLYKENYNYFELTGATEQVIASEIKSYMTEASSINEIVNVLRDACNEFIDSKVYHMIEYLNGTKPERMFAWRQRKIKKDGKDIWVDEKHRIPSVIIGETQVNGREKRVCIAVSWIEQAKNGFEGILLECIKSLEHEYLQPATYITAFPYTRVQPDDVYEKKKYYYAVPDTIQLKPNPNHRILIRNHYNRTEIVKSLLFNTISDLEAMKNDVKSKIYESPINKIDSDIEEIYFKKCWDDMGLRDNEELNKVIPYNTINHILHLRNHPSFEAINETLLEGYPKALADEIEAAEERTKDIEQNRKYEECVAMSEITKRPDGSSRQIAKIDAPAFIVGKRARSININNNNTPASPPVTLHNPMSFSMRKMLFDVTPSSSSEDVLMEDVSSLSGGSKRKQYDDNNNIILNEDSNMFLGVNNSVGSDDSNESFVLTKKKKNSSLSSKLNPMTKSNTQLVEGIMKSKQKFEGAISSSKKSFSSSSSSVY